MRDYFTYKTTLFLILVNTLFFLYLLYASNFHINANVLYRLGAIDWQSVAIRKEDQRFILSMFLHANIVHFATNMISLFLVGSIAELCFNRKEYLSIYFFGGFMGTLTYLFLVQNDMVVGASGAIFSLFGGLVGYYVVHKSIPFFNASEARKNFWIIIGLNIIVGISTPNIALNVHIAGALWGFVGGLLIAKYENGLLLYTVLSLAGMFALYEMLL